MGFMMHISIRWRAIIYQFMWSRTSVIRRLLCVEKMLGKKMNRLESVMFSELVENRSQIFERIDLKSLCSESVSNFYEIDLKNFRPTAWHVSLFSRAEMYFFFLLRMCGAVNFSEKVRLNPVWKAKSGTNMGFQSDRLYFQILRCRYIFKDH